MTAETTDKTKVIVVAYALGRSGTSAMMGLLQLAGANPGDPARSTQASDVNRKGFFEPKVLREFMVEVYPDIFERGDAPPSFDRLERAADEKADAYGRLLRQELGEKTPWAVKSYRSLTLPLMNRMTDQFDTRVIVLSRRLEDQARSLIRVAKGWPELRNKNMSLQEVSAWVATWQRWLDDVQQWYDFPYLAVNFEDVVAAPDETMNRVTRFADIPCPEQQVIEQWIDPKLVNRRRVSPPTDGSFARRWMRRAKRVAKGFWR